MWYFIVVIIVLVIIGLYAAEGNLKVYKKELASKGMNQSDFKFAGKFLYGHPNIDSILEKAYCYIFTEEIKIYEQLHDDFKYIEKGEIHFSKIKNISIEDKTTIQSRVGLKRLLVAGIFAFAMKKKEKVELLYLVVEWEDQGFTNETVFEFEGTNVQYCSSLKNSIQQSIINYKSNDRNLRSKKHY